MSIQEMAERVKGNIGQVIVGKAEVIELALVALLCEGHVLIEDVPGIGKATQALAAIRGREFVIPDDVKHLAPYVLTHRIISPQRLSKKIGRFPRDGRNCHCEGRSAEAISSFARLRLLRSLRSLAMTRASADFLNALSDPPAWSHTRRSGHGSRGFGSGAGRRIVRRAQRSLGSLRGIPSTLLFPS